MEAQLIQAHDRGEHAGWADGACPKCGQALALEMRSWEVWPNG